MPTTTIAAIAIRRVFLFMEFTRSVLYDPVTG